LYLFQDIATTASSANNTTWGNGIVEAAVVWPIDTNWDINETESTKVFGWDALGIWGIDFRPFLRIQRSAAPVVTA
jgi:hypothetical protein